MEEIGKVLLWDITSNTEVKLNKIFNKYLQILYVKVYFTKGSQDQFCLQNTQSLVHNFIVFSDENAQLK